MKNWLTAILCWRLFGLTLSENGSSDEEFVSEYCQHESFQPRCPAQSEVLLVRRATYGRMNIGRCVTSKEVDAHRAAYGNDRRYFGCSSDVLSVLDRKCSGKRECNLRVVDSSLEIESPCFPGLVVYLEVSYECVSVVDVKQSCHVMVTSTPSHVLRPSVNGGPSCGTGSQPLIVEAPVGQRIRFALIDFGPSFAQGVAGQKKPRCRNYGAVTDKSTNRNISICGGGGLDRRSELYSSNGNVVEVIFTPSDAKLNPESGERFLLEIRAVGCSDLIAPEDAWMKRSEDMIVIGCYSSRQSWHLRCEGERWIGVFGNCSQVHASILANPGITEKEASDSQVLTMVAVVGFATTICLLVLCVGLVCMRRMRPKENETPDYYRTLMTRVSSEQPTNHVTSPNQFYYYEDQQQQQQQPQQQQHQQQEQQQQQMRLLSSR